MAAFKWNKLSFLILTILLLASASCMSGPKFIPSSVENLPMDQRVTILPTDAVPGWGLFIEEFDGEDIFAPYNMISFKPGEHHFTIRRNYREIVGSQPKFKPVRYVGGGLYEGHYYSEAVWKNKTDVISGEVYVNQGVYTRANIFFCLKKNNSFYTSNIIKQANDENFAIIPTYCYFVKDKRSFKMDTLRVGGQDIPPDNSVIITSPGEASIEYRIRKVSSIDEDDGQKYKKAILLNSGCNSLIDKLGLQ